MAMLAVRFRYLTGLKRELFRNARLVGSWDGSGRFSAVWSETPMTPGRAEDGCPCFIATVNLDTSEVGKRFRWGVRLDGPSGPNIWGIPTEIRDMNSMERYREFTLSADEAARDQDFYFTYARRLGAREVFRDDSQASDLRFAVWAPNATAVDVVFGKPDNGYISDKPLGTGIDPNAKVFSLTKGDDGIFQSAVIPDFATFEGAPYMYRLTNAQGQTKFRTDLFSREQIGRGAVDPKKGKKEDEEDLFTGDPSTLDGTKGCSLVRSIDTVAKDVAHPEGERIPVSEFWATEFTPGLTVPSRIEDLIIYELHVNSLGAGENRPGNLQDAIALLPHLVDLGVNAVELLPMSEFSGGPGWGYGDSHHFTVETTAGGRSQYRHFVRECHRRGLAVIQDVCYNHWDFNAERDEWQYDSTAPEQNIYYWYEGKPSDYKFPEGGYVDNGSTGFAPRYWEEVVRHVFVSSAAALFEELHVDGLRVDLTQAIHRDNALHADGRGLGNVNLFGMKMLREWSRTLSMIRPNAMLIAEDHTGWDGVTRLPDTGGLGFGATWFAVFYHNLIGDSDMAGGKARLIKEAGFGGDGPLDIGQYAGELFASQFNRVVYHESHDEAGNAGGTARTIVVAVNDAPLTGVTREFAEARSRVAFGLSLLSAGTPMFFMGEEVGAAQPYRFNDFMMHREDIAGLRAGTGAKLFRFYQDLIRFSRHHPATRGHHIDIIHALGDNRLIAFTRLVGTDRLLVIASLRNQPFLDGYVIQTDPSRLPGGLWRESFNSDAAIYGGHDVGNFGADVPVGGGRIQVRVPANGLLVFQNL
ncbi:MAG TPA: alpha-amylase family glycosyl hydrolase [Isosphaeraceae bacterium]|nr:alpha-amylase family glycosyl hydrolase [Isosphaeraceae bacterium]